MKYFEMCARCQGRMAILDIRLEEYDLICTRCGERLNIRHALNEAPPCWQ